MAAAEARTAWQRTANRCFVQEDAKRAPKLATSSSLYKQVDTKPPNNGIDDFTPPNANSLYSNLSQDSRWWLQLQPNYMMHQKGLTNEKVNTFEAGNSHQFVDILDSRSIVKGLIDEKVNMFEAGNSHQFVDVLDSRSTVKGLTNERVNIFEAGNSLQFVDILDSRSIVKGLTDEKVNVLEAGNSRQFVDILDSRSTVKGLTNEKVNTSEAGNSHQFVDILDSRSTVKGGEESFEFVEMDSVFKKVDEFNLDSEFPHWMEIEKSDEMPWWRMTDDLASYVAQKSHDFVENCDLPQPLNTSFKRESYARDRSQDKKDEIFTSFSVSNPQKRQCQNASQIDNSGPVSSSSTQSDDNTIHETNQSKRKLLEALRHSQTRAREAEKAAKQAYAEKEHVVKLIFKQASQLFAYKQWLYLLQLENLYNQIKTNKITPIFHASPWQVPRRRSRRNINAEKRTREKRGIGVPNCKHDIGKYVAVFAVGLGLVGAGLLLGWTVGWMII